MKIITAQLQENGVLINGSIPLPSSNTGHVRTAYNEWLALGNEPDDIPEKPAPTNIEGAIKPPLPLNLT